VSKTKRKARLRTGTRKGTFGRDKPTVAAMPWDMGASGPANRHNLIEEDAPTIDPDTGKEHNPNGVKRMRRHSWISIYRRKGKLSERQFNTADQIHRASLGKLSDDPLRALFIDRGMACDDAQAAAFDRRRAFHRINAMIPDYARVVIDDEPLWPGTAHARHLDRLQRGLDEIADVMDAMRKVRKI
jgi:hypothetical protein